MAVVASCQFLVAAKGGNNQRIKLSVSERNWIISIPCLTGKHGDVERKFNICSFGIMEILCHFSHLGVEVVEGNFVERKENSHNDVALHRGLVA